MNIKNHYLGVNYWDSVNGTDMWAKYDHAIVEDDIRCLSEYGVKYMRVFPNWRDFQPVCKLRGWRGSFKQYRLVGDKQLGNELGLDRNMIAHFIDMCDIAERYGVKLIVSVVTGWMSGRLFCPPALENLNLMTDPEALMWTQRFVRGFVGAVKHHKAIEAWDLGNECNCLGTVESRAQAYHWTATVRNAILAEDNTRIIMSGMHGLEADENAVWQIVDQGELCDMLTPHPYPSPTIGAVSEPMNKPRTTLYPTAQVVYYSGIGGRPAMIQEQGTFTEMLGNRKMAADFIRVNLLSGLAHGSMGHLYWCAFEHLKLTQPPYTWSMVERELGLFDVDKNPKPVAYEVKNMNELLSKLPFDELPDRDIDAVCITTAAQGGALMQWQSAAGTFVLAKQAGIDITVRHFTQEIPEAKIYIVPSINGWAPMYAETYNFLIDRVKNHGATLYISVDNGQLNTIEQVAGLRSNGMGTGKGAKKGEFVLGGENITLPYNAPNEFLAESVGAEVLGHQGGNVIFSRYQLGKGKVYMLGFPLEQLAHRDGLFNAEEPYYKIYSEFASDAIKEKIVRTEEKYIGITQHRREDGSYIIIVINYTDGVIEPKLQVADGWNLTPVYGDEKTINGCNGAIFLATK